MSERPRRPQRHISFAGVTNDDNSSTAKQLKEEEFETAYSDDDICLSSDGSSSRGSEETAFNAGARTPALSRITPARFIDFNNSIAGFHQSQPITPTFATSKPQKRFSWTKFKTIILKRKQLEGKVSSHDDKGDFQVNRFVVLFVSCVVAVLTGPFFFNWAATQKFLLARNAYAHYCHESNKEFPLPPLPGLPIFSQGYSVPSPAYAAKGGLHLFVPEGTALIFSLPSENITNSVPPILRQERRRQLREALEVELAKFSGPRKSEVLRLDRPVSRRLLQPDDTWRWWLFPRSLRATNISFWELFMPTTVPLAMRRLLEDNPSVCSEQLAAINALMPIGVAAWFICSFLGGAFCDLVGSRCSLILAMALASIGWVLLSLCGQAFPSWTIAFAAIGASIDATFFPLMATITPLFDKHRGVALACLTAARALANQTPKVHMSFSSGHEVTAAVHAVLIGVAATLSYFFMPNSSSAAGSISRIKKCSNKTLFDWLMSIVSKKYLALLPLACLTVLRGSFLANTAADQFGDDLMPTFARLALCTLLLCPMLGTLADYAGTRTVFLLTNSVACIQFFCLSFLSHNKGFLLLAAALHPVVSAFFIGQFYFHIAACHGNENIGLRIGLTVALSGPFGLLVTPMYGYSLSRESFSPMNRLCLILSLFCFPLIFSLDQGGPMTKLNTIAPPKELMTPTTGVQPTQTGVQTTKSAETDDIPLTPNVVYK